jgi:hypothetical protein
MKGIFTSLLSVPLKTIIATMHVFGRYQLQKRYNMYSKPEDHLVTLYLRELNHPALKVQGFGWGLKVPVLIPR